MNKEVDVLSSAITTTTEPTESAEPSRDATRESAAAWRDGEVEQDLTDASHQSESSPEGTLRSNTVTQYPITAIVSISSF